MVERDEEFLEYQLDKIQDGAIPYLFDRELRRVISNMLDLSTEAKDKREITVKVVFSPNEQRTAAEVAAFVSSKTTQVMPVPSTMSFGIAPNGKMVALDPQTKLFDEKDKQMDQPSLVKTGRGE